MVEVGAMNLSEIPAFQRFSKSRANHVDVHLNERRRQTEGGLGIKMEVEGEYHLLNTSQFLIE